MSDKSNVYIGVVSDSANTYDICLSKAIQIIDEAETSQKWYKQVVSKVDSVNGNIRLYPKKVYSNTLDNLKKKCFPNAGEHPHPDTFMGADGKLRFRTSIPNAAVKFRNAYIDETNNVWAEYKVLDTAMGKQVQTFIDNNLPFGFSNRMTGELVPCEINGMVIDVAKELELYTWDIVLNPAENDTLSVPIPLTDNIETIMNTIENKESGKRMDFFKMSLEELIKWKEENKESKEISVCDVVIEEKKKMVEAEERIKALNDELKAKEEEKRKEEQKKQVQKILTDSVLVLPYDEKTKQAMIEGGKEIEDVKEVTSYIEKQRAIIDSIVVNTRLNALGVPQDNAQKKAYTISVKEPNPIMPIVDNLMEEMDRELQKKDHNFKIDKGLRTANKMIIDTAFKQMERENNSEYAEFQRVIHDSIKVIHDDATPAISTTGQFAQSSVVSLAILYQAWQDTNFLQLCMTEAFSGSTYKMPVEFQSHDLFNEDDFVTGELDGIPTESSQTFLLEFGAEWLKRGFVVTKEAEREMLTGPMRYDIVARNTANIANRFSRIIDRKISTEMIARADEYMAKRVSSELVAATEIEEITAGINAPEGTNAKFKVTLLCGSSSPFTGSVVLPPIVRPRVSVWLDSKGRKQQELINEIVVKDKNNQVLTGGRWNVSNGKIISPSGKEAQYAVDYENSCIYFVDGVISKTDLPKIQYSYATNIAFFNLAVPSAMADFSARYYNKLLEMIDVQKAYMGSAPRYVTPDFVLGSLNSMIPLKQAELFYQRALPDGTSLLGGEMYFGRRNGVELAEHNAPWVAGDGRLLLGKRNAVRVGMGSPYDLEGPYPHMAGDGRGYTSAKEYLASQQIAINTPLVIDENGVQYHPPFRTIKYYTAAH